MLGDFHKSHLVVVSLFISPTVVSDAGRPCLHWTRLTCYRNGSQLCYSFDLIFSHHLFPNLSLMLVRFYEVSPVILLSLYETLYRRPTRKVPQFVMYCCT